jgi:hypothetical protein
LSTTLVVVGIASYSVALTLPAFRPCRVFYRVHNPVQDTLACHVFTLLSTFGLIAGFLGIAMGAVTLVAALAKMAAGRRARS